MMYKIIIAQNGKKKKVMHKSSDIKFIKQKYFNIKDRNKVLLPKKTNSYLKTKPVKYELILMKKWGEKDIAFLDKDELGRTMEIKDINKKWTILFKDEYYYEETFTVFNYTSRMTSQEIIKKIVLKNTDNKIVKQINYLNNKLLIYQNNDFDIILCKCPADAKSLYNIIKEFCECKKISNIMFTDAVGDLNKTEIYKMIIEKTGWSRNKSYRTVTRP